MAAEESSQGPTLGPDVSDPERADGPPNDDVPDLHDVLWEFLRAVCALVDCVEQVAPVLERDAAGAHGLGRLLHQLLKGKGNGFDQRFDRGLVAHERFRCDGAEASGGNDDDDIVIEIGESEEAAEDGTAGNRPV